MGSIQAGSSLGASMMGKSGIDKRYLSIKEISEPSFQRNAEKTEGNIAPDKGSTIKIRGKK